MRVGPLLTLLLSGLGSSVSAWETTKTTVSDKEAAAAEKRGDRPDRPTRPTYLHPRDKMNGRGPVASTPLAGAKQDVTGSNDQHLSEVTEFAAEYLTEQNSELTYIQVKAEVQVVAGMMYTLRYRGNDAAGECLEERTLVIYDKPWLDERTLKSDTVTECT
ncbi:unnamed protein product [Ectocarpus sp. 6 AP-2014]